jgi:hypothetical protein
VLGPTQGALDLTLTLRADRVVLRWRAEKNGLGSQRVEHKVAGRWQLLASLDGRAAEYEVRPLPPAGERRSYRVVWIEPSSGRRFLSDELGVRLGAQSGPRPVRELSIALYQQHVPYVRFSIPTAPCRSVVPCAVEGHACGTDGHCRGGNGAAGLASDYHPGRATYALWREGALEPDWVGFRSPGWEGQYNHLSWVAAGALTPGGREVAYRVVAHPLKDGAPEPDLAAPFGTSDELLAVPGRATVGLP